MKNNPFLVVSEWCDRFFLPKNQERLNDCYKRVASRLKNAGIRVAEGQAALFAWMDVSAYLPQQSFAEEIGEY